ncbi:MAG: molecular chaperone TorD family protein [Chloroflexi bacterium]|nr:molecular chaperone TorD family protein [Chloroflexota bacterium]
MTTATQSLPLQAAIFRSALYETLALSFAYPTPHLGERLEDAIADLLELPEVAEAGYADDLMRMRDALAASSTDVLAMEHNHLFEHSTFCSPYETEYEPDPFAKARQLADIAGFYTAFGMSVSTMRPTLQDFLGTELEFMSFLARKEAYAAARNWRHRRQVTVDAERAFLHDHLGRWEKAVCKDVTDHTAMEAGMNSAAPFFGAVASLCVRFVEDELRRFGTKPLRLTQRMVGNEEPVACPFASAAAEDELEPLDPVED